MEAYERGEVSVKPLGEGLFSKVFQFSRFPRIVIKESKGNSDFRTEQRNMQEFQNLLPNFNNASRFHSRLYSTNNKYYLVSSKVDGQHPHPQRTPWTHNALTSLFHGLYQMDSVGFYHGDLNNKNLLIDSANVNFIDLKFSPVIQKTNFFIKKNKSKRNQITN